MKENITSFDPKAWANMNNADNVQDNMQTNHPSALLKNARASVPPCGELAKARAITEDLISRGANIAESYDDYVKLGFSLAQGLGIDGHDLYHELCAQSTKYSYVECEAKWQECLSKHNSSVTIASFYKMANDCGVNVAAYSSGFSSNPQNPQYKEIYQNNENSTYSNDLTLFPQGEENEESEENVTTTFQQGLAYTNTFSDKIDFTKLPPLLQDIASTQSAAEDQDMMILGSLTVFSGSTPNVFGIYDKRRVFPPFYSLVIAPPASGKGIMPACVYLLCDIEKHMERLNEREDSKYRREMAVYTALNKSSRYAVTPPQEPAYHSMWVPANSSVISVYKALADNDGIGITFETEADTLSQTFNSEYGNFSDILRKGFHHEDLKLNRRKDNTHIVVRSPRWAILLTCTPSQIQKLLSSSGNGTESRFIFYLLSRRLEWRNVFDKNSMTLEQQFTNFGHRFFKIYKALYRRKGHPIEFVLSTAQQEKFNQYFNELQLEQTSLHGDELIAFVRRLGLVCFRIAMVLTIIRQETQHPVFDPLSQTLVCNDDDFETAMTISNCLINNTACVYSSLKKDDEKENKDSISSMTPIERSFYQSLPDNFTTKDFRACATKLNIKQKTAERYIGHLIDKYHLVNRIQNGQYSKVKK